jgi:hypothetical protein
MRHDEPIASWATCVRTTPERDDNADRVEAVGI